QAEDGIRDGHVTGVQTCALPIYRGSSGGLPARVRMRLEVQLPTSAIGYVGVELRRRKVGVAQHLLDRTQVGADFEQMRGEGVPEQVRVHAFRLEARFFRESPEDQERASTCEPSAFRIQEELGSVSRIDEWPSVRQIPPKCLRRLAADRHDPLLRPLADAPD